MVWLERWRQVTERDARNGDSTSISWWQGALYVGYTVCRKGCGASSPPGYLRNALGDMGNQSRSEVFFLLDRVIVCLSKSIILMTHLQTCSFRLPLSRLGSDCWARAHCCLPCPSCESWLFWLGDQASARTRTRKRTEAATSHTRESRGADFPFGKDEMLDMLAPFPETRPSSALQQSV